MVIYVFEVIDSSVKLEIFIGRMTALAGLPWTTINHCYPPPPTALLSDFLFRDQCNARTQHTQHIIGEVGNNTTNFAPRSRRSRHGERSASMQIPQNIQNLIAASSISVSSIFWSFKGMQPNIQFEGMTDMLAVSSSQRAMLITTVNLQILWNSHELLVCASAFQMRSNQKMRRPITLALTQFPKDPRQGTKENVQCWDRLSFVWGEYP